MTIHSLPRRTLRTQARRALHGAICALVLAGCGAGTGQDSAAPSPRQLAAASAAPGSAASAYQDALQRIYLAYFGRPADPAGLAYYANLFAQAGVPTDIGAITNAYATIPVIKSVIDGFGTSAESRTLYPGDNDTFLNAIYRNLFNRAPDAAGKAYWVDLLNKGSITRGSAALAIMAAAQSTDATLIDYKGRVAVAFTADLNTDARVSAYDGQPANAVARALLAQVTLATDVAAFEAQVEASVAALAGAPHTPGIYLLAGSAGGTGVLDGPASAARFDFTGYLGGLAVDAGGTIYVTDPRDDLVRKISPAGVVSTVAGASGDDNVVDGPAALARFNTPRGIAVDAAGTLYVASDYGDIRRITADGTVSTFATGGDISPGVSAFSPLHDVHGLCIDAAGNLYVADTGNYVIRKITPQGRVTVVAGAVNRSGYVDGAASAARFYKPVGVTVNASGTLFVADSEGRTIRRIGTDGVVSTLVGVADEIDARDGVGQAARFRLPNGIVASGTDVLYVADGSTVRKITGINGTAPVVTTLAGQRDVRADVDGAAPNARLTTVNALAVDSAGAVLLTSTAAVRRVALDGSTSTVAGLSAATGSADGTGGNARFGTTGNGGSLFGAPDGSVLVADNDNGTVRQVSLTGVVTTIAGVAGEHAVIDGPAASARFNMVRALARDSAGALYVSDDSVIRKIAPDGSVSSVAGKAGVAGLVDGDAATARFGTLNSMVFDSTGNLIVLDMRDGSTVLRKVSPSGAVSTFAHLDRDDVDAYAEALAIDAQDNLYLADSANHLIVKVTPDGTLSIVAGVRGDGADIDGAAGVARLNYPIGIAYDPAGKLYVIELSGLLREVDLAGNVRTVAGTPGASGVGSSSALPGHLPVAWSIAYLAPKRFAVSADAGVLTVILP